MLEKKLDQETSNKTRLANLLNVIQNIASGDFSIRAQKEKDDVIGMLAVGINMMIDDLEELIENEKELTASAEGSAEAEKEKASELLAVNQQLRASEQQLKAANQQLKAKEQALQSSDEELHNKITDLERFNRLMVGRELQMVELKREVNSLLEKLRQPKKYQAPDRANKV